MLLTSCNQSSHFDSTDCIGPLQGLVGRRLHVLAAAVQRDITAAHEDLVYTLDWQASHSLPASAPPLLQMTGDIAMLHKLQR